MIRITADIDTKNKIIIAWNILKALFVVDKIQLIELKPSNSKGFHLFVWTTKRYKKDQVFRLRKIIGDDTGRIAIDKKRRKPKQYFFFTKKKMQFVDGKIKIIGDKGGKKK